MPRPCGAAVDGRSTEWHFTTRRSAICGTRDPNYLDRDAAGIASFTPTNLRPLFAVADDDGAGRNDVRHPRRRASWRIPNPHVRRGDTVSSAKQGGARRRAKVRKAPAPSASPTTGVRRKNVAAAPPFVLVVDDVEDNRELYGVYFTFAGFRVAQAADGEEALARVAKEKPDLVIMDLSMPRMDGWEATRLIKSNPRTKSVIVIVVTGHATPHDLDRAKAAGADEVLTKPCVPEALLARARALLDK